MFLLNQFEDTATLQQSLFYTLILTSHFRNQTVYQRSPSAAKPMSHNPQRRWSDTLMERWADFWLLRWTFIFSWNSKRDCICTLIILLTINKYFLFICVPLMQPNHLKNTQTQKTIYLGQILNDNSWNWGKISGCPKTFSHYCTQGCMQTSITAASSLRSRSKVLEKPLTALWLSFPPGRKGSGRRRSPDCLSQRHQEGGLSRWADCQSHLLQRGHQGGHRWPESGERLQGTRSMPMHPSRTSPRDGDAFSYPQIYYYSEAQTTHVTYPDGLEVLHFPNNQTGESGAVSLKRSLQVWNNHIEVGKCGLHPFLDTW